MIRFVKRLWSSTPFAVLVLTISLIVAGVFATRSIGLWVYWNDPAHRAQAIEPWMTPKYISHSWRVPPHVVIEALGPFDQDKKGPMSLDQIAAMQDVPPHIIVRAVQDAIHTFNIEAPHRQPPPPPHKPAPRGAK